MTQVGNEPNKLAVDKSDLTFKALYEFVYSEYSWRKFETWGVFYAYFGGKW